MGPRDAGVWHPKPQVPCVNWERRPSLGSSVPTGLSQAGLHRCTTCSTSGGRLTVTPSERAEAARVPICPSSHL